MSEVETQDNSDSGTVSPDEPSVEDNTESVSDYGFGDYDANIIQISDTEGREGPEGVPYEEIIDQYEPGEVDAVVFAGDASKKNELNPADFLARYEGTLEELQAVQEELDTEVLFEPGNHSPIAGSHNAGGWVGAEDDEEYVEQIEEILADEYEEFSESSEDAYEFLVDEYDLTDIQMDSVDVGDVTVVGGTHHDGELDFDKEWLEEAPELEELGYSEEEIESIAEDLEDSGLLAKFLKVITLGRYSGSSPDAGDVSLDDIPDDYEDMSEAHEDYQEAIELYEGLTEMIEEAENDVYLAHHGVPDSAVDNFGSTVVEKIMEDYEEEGKLAGVGGGHTGEDGYQELYGKPTINTNYGAVHELGFENGSLEYENQLIEGDKPGPSEEEKKEQRKEFVEEVDRAGGPEAYKEQMEEELDQIVEEKDLKQEEEEQLRENMEQQAKTAKKMWEEGIHKEILEEDQEEENDVHEEEPAGAPA